MQTMLIKLITMIAPSVLEYLLKYLQEYIKSSKTDKDDVVLQIVQQGCTYLADKPTTTVTEYDADNLSRRTVTDIFYGSKK